MKRISVVEDNPDNLLLVQALLEDLYVIEDHSTGAEALLAWKRNPPDLILMDISLPGMDGLTLLGMLRSDAALQGIPVIALTAHAMVDDRRKFLQAGFDEYVSKPIVDESVLLDAIQRLIERNTGGG